MQQTLNKLHEQKEEQHADSWLSTINYAESTL